MATQTLICENGKHEWTREASRGRKPRFCPQHAAMAANPLPNQSNGNEVLHCEAGHTFTRPNGQRGRKPRFCPDHAPVKIERPKVVKVSANGDVMETLHCENGDHDWSRKRTKGKKPSSCPEHRTSPQVVSTTTRPHVISLAELEAKYNVDEESRRVLGFIESAVQSPTWPDRREAADVRSLMAAYRARIRQVTRGDRDIMAQLALVSVGDEIEEETT